MEDSPKTQTEWLKLAAISAIDLVPGGKALKLLKGAAGKVAMKKMEKQLLKEARKAARRVGKVANGVANTSGLVKRSVFNSLDPAIKKKVAAAIENGIVAPTGKQGIIKLTATEAAQTGYQYKVKILGKGGNIRIYGNLQENGHIFFDKIMGH